MQNNSPEKQFESTGVFVYTLFADNREKIEIVNNEICEIWGYGKEEIERDASLIWDRIDDEYIEPMKTSVMESAQSLQVWSATYKYHAPDGTVKILHSSGYPYKSTPEETAWISSVRDLSEMIEITRIKHDYEMRYAALLDTVQDGIIFTNESFSIISVNEAAATMFGYSKDYLINQPVNILLDPGVHDKHIQYMDGFKHGKETMKRMGPFRKVMGMTSSGKLFPVNVSIGKAKIHDSIIFIATIRSVMEQNKQLVDSLKTNALSDLYSVNAFLDLYKVKYLNDAPPQQIQDLNKVMEIVNKTIKNISEGG